MITQLRRSTYYGSRLNYTYIYCKLYELTCVRYDLLALTASLLWLIAGTKFVLGLYIYHMS